MIARGISDEEFFIEEVIL